MALPMRRFTLLTVIGLFIVLTAAAIYQIVLVTGKPVTGCGPGLSGGEDKVVLLDLTNRLREDAIEELENADLAYRVEPRAIDPLDDKVASQAPASCAVLAEGTVVTLVVRCRPAPCPSPPEGETIVDPCGCGTA